MEKKIKIAIADDVNVFSEALKESLETDRDIQVVKVFNDLYSLEKNIQSLFIDVLILDINFKGQSSLSIVDKLFSRFNNFKIIALTTLDNEPMRQSAKEKGIHYFVGKDISLSKFKMFVKSIAFNDDIGPNPEVAFKKMKVGNMSLTKVKIRVLQGLYEYAAFNEECIANELGIKESTLKTHKRELFEIFDTKKVAELIKIGIKNGIIIP